MSMRHQWVTPRTVGRLGALLTLLLFAVGYVAAWQGYRKQFAGDASLRSTVVINSLQGRLQELDGLRRFMEAVGPVDREVFLQAAGPIMRRTGIQALEWVPSVQRGNEQAYGFDPGSDLNRLAAMREAEQSGETRATARIRLVQAPGEQYGLLLYAPVRERGRLRGFVAGLFRVGDQLDSALQATSTMPLDTNLLDLSAPSGEEPLQSYKVPNTTARQFPGVDDLLFPLPEYRREFLFAGRRWLVSSVATRGYHADAVSLAFLLILPVGALITWLSVLSLRRQVLSKEEIERQVVSRTAELSRAITELMQARSHMQIMLDNLPMLAWLKDEAGRFLMVNSRFAEGIGRPAEEILGLTAHDVWPHDLADYYTSIDEEVMAMGFSRQVEEQIVGVHGPAWFEAFKAPITSSDGRVLGTTGIAIDITRRKQNEAQLLKHQCELQLLNSRLEERVEEEISLNRAKELQIMRQEKLASIGQLAAGVAHEINTPLGYVTGNIQAFNSYFEKLCSYLIAQDALLSGAITEEQRRELSDLAHHLDIDYILEDAPALITESLHGAERVARIVRDLKSFSRVDALEFEDVDLTLCLESTLGILTHELKEVATIDREYQPLPPVFCNPGEMNQLFLNLLRNAAAAVKPPGRITLKSWYDDAHVSLSVGDNGHGIPEELRVRIFEPFFTTKKVGQGTGLGLSVAHDIVTKHLGELRVESSVGDGSIFTVTLPRNPGPSC